MHINIGLLFDDFDPPMTSHLVMAQNALDTGLIDSVWLIPPHGSISSTWLLSKDHEHVYVCSEDSIDYPTPEMKFFMVLDEDQKGNISNVLNEFPPILVNKPESGIVPPKVLDYLKDNGYNSQ